MLNLSFIFDDANCALTAHSDRVTVRPLPAAVYMMQVDVINHYRYALSHYFMLTLHERFLQNSSLGTPYQKWAFFVNKHFEMLSFAVHNLLRYTSRLVHETGCMVVSERGRKSEYKSKSNSYTDPICAVRFGNKPIGVIVRDDQQLAITAIRREPYPFPILMRCSNDGPTEYVRIVKDSAGNEREEPTNAEEFGRAMEAIQVETVDIRDRSHLALIRDRGMAEIAALDESNRVFGAACNAFYASRNVAEPFRNLNESYWV